MQILFHAGFHKTGTSSLQQALMEHRDALAPFAHIETRALSPTLADAADAARRVSVEPGPMAVGALQSAFARWVAFLPDPGDRALVVSSEDFAGHMPGRHGLTDYRAVALVIPMVVEALQARFPGVPTKILFTTRQAGAWLPSLHWQLSKHPDLVLKQRRFCKEFAAAADFGAVLKPLTVALSGRAEVEDVALESLDVARLGPVEVIYDRIALPSELRDMLDPVDRVRQRPPLELADQFILMNRAKLPQDELSQAKHLMIQMARRLLSDDGRERR